METSNWSAIKTFCFKRKKFIKNNLTQQTKLVFGVEGSRHVKTNKGEILSTPSWADTYVSRPEDDSCWNVGVSRTWIKAFYYTQNSDCVWALCLYCLLNVCQRNNKHLSWQRSFLELLTRSFRWLVSADLKIMITTSLVGKWLIPTGWGLTYVHQKTPAVFIDVLLQCVTIIIGFQWLDYVKY